MRLLPSTMGPTARIIGRRSKRILMIRQNAAAAAAAEGASDHNKVTGTVTATAAVSVTPSPKREPTPTSVSSSRETITASGSSSRKRKTAAAPTASSPSSPPLPDVSRSLQLVVDDDQDIDYRNTVQPDVVPSATMRTPLVENNALELTTDMVADINPTQEFIDLQVPPEELRPSNTLTTGQCFHWKVVHPKTKTTTKAAARDTTTATPSAWGTFDATEWVGVLRLRLFDSYESVVVVVRELPDTTLYRPLTITGCTKHEDKSKTEIQNELHRALWEYFQLDVSLPNLYQEWSQACSRLSTIAKCIPGVRIIKQDPWECLVSFICSSNNNIPRITKMLASIRKEYGQPLLQIPAAATAGRSNSSSRIKGGNGDGNNDQQAHSNDYYQFYSFPSLEEMHSLANDEDLRAKCGMGYRANYILETMKILRDDGGTKGGEVYLHETLCNIQDPIKVQTLLCEFKGVGQKVADCVALFSLNQDDAIPVDTHVWNIAIRDYDPEGTLKTSVKSLTPSNYKLVGDIFRSRFPNRAGWAHSLLFVAELPSFRGLLPEYLTNEMDEFQREEKERKKELKEKKQKQKSQ